MSSDDHILKLLAEKYTLEEQLGCLQDRMLELSALITNNPVYEEGKASYLEQMSRARIKKRHKREALREVSYKIAKLKISRKDHD